MKRRNFLGALAALSAFSGCGEFELPQSLPAISAGELPVADLERALDEAFQKVTAPGIIAGVKRGAQHWTSLRGSSSRGTSNLPGPLFHSRIGSVTKTVTATAILQLVDEGKLGLDEPIGRWFPAMPDGSQITVRMLGNMSSGIASFTQFAETVLPYFADPFRVWDPADSINFCLAQPRRFAPGTEYHYSNTNFLMLGHIIEQLRQQPIGDAFRDHIFRVLGMQDTSYPLTNDLPQPHWQGYTLQGVTGDQPIDSTSWSPTFFGASGQLVSTVSDLLILARELGTGGLLRLATQLERLKPNTASTVDGDSYLFGLAIHNGWLTHAGASPGFIADVAYLPGSDISIAVMANSDVLLPIGQGSADFVSRSLRLVLAPNTAGPIGEELF